jgi:hypothetical protein
MNECAEEEDDEEERYRMKSLCFILFKCLKRTNTNNFKQ